MDFSQQITRAATAVACLALIGLAPGRSPLPGSWERSVLTVGSVGTRAVPLSPCAIKDNGDPDVLSLAFDQPVVDARAGARTLRVVATAADTGGPGPATGIRDFRVAFSRPTGGQQQAVVMRRASDGTWVGELVVRPGFRWPGIYRVDTVELSDAVGNNAFLASAWLQEHALDADVTIVSEPDTRRPHVTDLKANRIVADSTNGPARVRYTATLEDPSGVEYAFIDVGFKFRAEMHRISGTERRGRWTGVATIPRWQQEQVATLDLALQAGDHLDNTRVLLRDQLEHRGWPGTLLVRAVADTRRPSLRLLRQSAETVDVRQRPGRIVVTVRAADAGSGIGSVGLGYGDDTFSYFGKRISGDRHRGMWQVTIPLPYCFQRGGSDQRRISIGAWDRLGRLGFTDRRLTYTVLSSDTRGPGRIRFQDLEEGVPPGGPAVLTFGEAVTGITNSSIPVRPFDPDSPPGTEPASPVAGTWACRDSAGITIDCTTGAVRAASWTPAAPLAPGVYVADVNPEHSLDVTDLVGNPPPSYLDPAFHVGAL